MPRIKEIIVKYDDKTKMKIEKGMVIHTEDGGVDIQMEGVSDMDMALITYSLIRAMEHRGLIPLLQAIPKVAKVVEMNVSRETCADKKNGKKKEKGEN